MRLEAHPSVARVVEPPLLYCSHCRTPLHEDANFITCLTCDCALCPNCNSCLCDDNERKHIHLVFNKCQLADAVL
jgi:hypothetical protein